ncbi:MAG: TRIC cation channel family protein [Eubacteriales bacterium]|nr:TRIC cation channel family protein [Eubacteriales bacterium]
MDYQELIILIIEIIGTVAFSISGAMVGTRRGMDIFGVCVLGVVTAVGGGMIRDIILGITPPNVFREPVYALVAVLTACVVFIAIYLNKTPFSGSERQAYERLILMMDSIGLGIFTVMGVLTGVREGYVNNTFFLVFLGTTTGVGGGLLRDMMAGVPPYIFVRHIYACASIVGALICVYLYRLTNALAAMIIASAVVVLIRFLAAHYRWNLPSMAERDIEKD